jgi:hypothetical protein
MIGNFIKKHKFHAKRTEIHGIRFDSKKEAQYYKLLKISQEEGSLLFFLRQVPFDLPGNVKYKVDFVEFWKNGDINFVDIKGFATSLYKTKKKMIESLYPIEIQER